MAKGNGKLSHRDAQIVEWRARGRSHQKIADDLGLSKSGARYIAAKYPDHIQARTDELTERLLKGSNKAIDATLEVASDAKHPRQPDAFRELSKIIWPPHGSKVEVNIAAGDIHQDAQYQENTVILAELRGKSNEEIEERLKEIEARFVREEAPVTTTTPR